MTILFNFDLLNITVVPLIMNLIMVALIPCTNTMFLVEMYIKEFSRVKLKNI